MGDNGRRLIRLSLLIAALVFVTALAQLPMRAQGRAGGQNRTSAPARGSCPLTDAQTTKAIEAWARIATFLTTEPRCLNCHGGLNPFIKGPGLDPGDDLDNPTPASKVAHGQGGVIRRQRDRAPDGTQLMEGECMDCHNNMVRKRDGSPSRWTLAPTFLSFVDKDPTTLCRQIKRATGTADHFLGHLKDDNGGNAFAPTAFKGDKGLDPDRFDFLMPQPPKMSHAAFMKLGQDWVAAMGGSFKGDEGCGCEFRHAKWSGQIDLVVESTYPEIHDEQVDSSGRRFSQITYTFTDGVGTATATASVNARSDMRRGVVDNNTSRWIKDSSDESTGSGGRTFPATVEVTFRPNGQDYSIAPAISGSLQIGTWNTVSCRYDRSGAAKCNTQVLQLYADSWTSGDLSSTSRDPNHVQGSKVSRQEAATNGQRGAIIRTLRWDLWRSN